MAIIKELKKLELKYENFAIFILSLYVAYIILTPPYFQGLVNFIQKSGEWGYIGAFIAGSGYSYGILMPVSIATLFVIGSSLNPFLIAFVGAFGATLGDFIIFIFSRDTLGREVEKIEKRHKKFSRFVKKFALIIALIIIALPIPDEFASAFLGTIRFQTKKFFIFVYISNFIGILLVSGLGLLYG